VNEPYQAENVMSCEYEPNPFRLMLLISLLFWSAVACAIYWGFR
jgi:hypothetical protein